MKFVDLFAGIGCIRITKKNMKKALNCGCEINSQIVNQLLFYQLIYCSLMYIILT